MKLKLFLSALAVCLFAFTSKAQIESFEGIGKFKLKKVSTSIVTELEAELNLKLEKANNSDEVYDKMSSTKNVLAEVFPDTVNTMNSYLRASYCKKTRVFYLKEYTVANIKIENIFLTFYNDTLVNFESDASSELVDALDTKYGKAKLEVKEKKSSCYIGGSKITVTETTGIRNWKNNVVSAKTYSMSYYNSECKERFLFVFEITCEDYPTLLKKCSDDEKTRIEAKKEEEKKKGLSDF